MKKSIFLAVALVISLISFSQENSEKSYDNQKTNELKINGLLLVAGSFEVAYERALNEESAIGVSAFIPFDEDIKENINYYVSPYYRFFFGKKYASGFFVEGFGMLNSTKNDRIIFFDNLGNILNNQQDNITDFALGIGLGGKWVTRRGLLAELNFGIGRNLFNTSKSDTDFVGKIGITVGFRF